MELDAKQQEAVTACCEIDRRLAAVTGQAGTGKTTIMRHVHQLLTDAGYVVALCAPTGKAAKRIQEATGIPAKTIHRLLEYSHPGEKDPKTGKAFGISQPKRHMDNPLIVDFVLCDEYAMVNEELHSALLDALPRGGRLRVFGDVNQLQPIESERDSTGPSPFTRLLRDFQGIVLDHIHRQGEGSGIVENGALINRGLCPRKREDFEIIVTDKPVERLLALLDARKVAGSDFATTRNQVLTTSNKTWIGTVALNTQLQAIFFPEVENWVDIPRHTWAKAPLRLHAGDKVIITQNNYGLEVFNGETGIIEEITPYEEVIINLGDRTIAVPPSQPVVNKYGKDVMIDPRRDIDLAYCTTTHKAQGSEFEEIVYVLNKSCFFMQDRKNFYTAITRARKRVTLITDQRSFMTSVLKK